MRAAAVNWWFKNAVTYRFLWVPGKIIMKATLTFAVISIAVMVWYSHSLGYDKEGGAMTTGSFRIYLDGQILASEAYGYNEREKEIIIRSGVIVFQDNENDSNSINLKAVLSMDRDGKPMTYELSKDMGGSPVELKISFTKTHAVSVERRVQIHSSHMHVLDNLMTSHYELLIGEYNRRKEEKYHFFAFVPQVMMEVPASITCEGKEIFEDCGAIFYLNRYEIIVGSNLITAYSDDDSRIVRLLVPSQRIEILRDGYDGSEIVPLEVDQVKEGVRNTIEEEIRFQGKDVDISGAITKPYRFCEPAPGALFISGSGTKDRNGRFLEHNIDLHTKELAVSLSESGLVVLRYDDRGVGLSRDCSKTVTFSEQILDAGFALSFLRHRSEVDKNRVFLIGHSAGALIAALIAADNPDIAGVILMAAPAKPLRKIFAEQAQTLLRLNNVSQEAIDVALAQQEEFFLFIESYQDGAPIPHQFSNYEHSLLWLQELLSLEPSSLYPRIQSPVLILHGGKDIQVSKDNAELIYESLKAAGNEMVQMQIFPDLDHIFMKSEDGNIARYFDKSRVLSPEVLEHIKHWTKNH